MTTIVKGGSAATVADGADIVEGALADAAITTNATGTMTNVQIDAAILAMKHSFMVDNYFCGGPLGTLTLNGSITQLWRGPVGQGSGTITQGYAKNYNYDDRLRYRTPPKFMDPVASAWRTLATSEQTPPT